MEQWFLAYALHLLHQFGLQHSRFRPPSLPRPVQMVMERDGRPEAVVYDSGDHLPYHLYQPNATLFYLPFWEEDHCGPS